MVGCQQQSWERYRKFKEFRGWVEVGLGTSFTKRTLGSWREYYQLPDLFPRTNYLDGLTVRGWVTFPRSREIASRTHLRRG